MSSENTVGKRIVWIDLLRAVAIFGVVADHAAEGICPMNVSQILTLNTAERCFAFTVFSLGRLGVPLFLMISGYLLLDRKYDRERCIRFWRGSWLHLLICTEIWWVIYNIFLYFLNSDFSAGQLAAEVLFLRAVPLNHTWYMPALLGLYLFIPFLANGLAETDFRMLKFPMLFVSAYLFGAALLKTAFQVLDLGEINVQLSAGFSGGLYGFYMIMGYLLKKGCFRKYSRKTLTASCGCTAVLMTQFMLWCYRNEFRYNTWYDNPFLLICSISLFELVSEEQYSFSKRGVSVIRFLSRYSFGVYLIHNIFRFMLLPYFRALTIYLPVNIFAFWAVLMVLSYFSVWLISRIGYFGRYILYLK